MNEHFIVVFLLDIYPYPKQKAFQFMTYELYRRETTPPPPQKNQVQLNNVYSFFLTSTAKDLKFNLSNNHVCNTTFSR